MIEITSCMSVKKMVQWLEENASKNEILALAVALNKKGEDVAVYGTKEQLLWGLRQADRSALYETIEALYSIGESDAEEDELFIDEDDSSEEE